MRVSEHLRANVEQFSRDFATVTGRWIKDGWHTTGEVEAWRKALREYMQSADRTDGDVRDVCVVWRGFARSMKNG